MSLTILLLLVFMLLLLVCGWRNKYYVLFACLAAAMAGSQRASASATKPSSALKAGPSASVM